MKQNSKINNFILLNNIKNDPKNSKTYKIENHSIHQTYVNGRQCPHCKSRNVVSNGNYKGRKKYKCKDCNKNYNDLTGSPFSGIHNLSKMNNYISCMVDGKSIRKSSSEVGVSISTSFFWRHKILKMIDKLPKIKLKEVIELDEFKIAFSSKGRKRSPTKDEMSRKVSVTFGSDRTGKLLAVSDKISANNCNKAIEFWIDKLSKHQLIFKPKRIFTKLESDYVKKTKLNAEISNVKKSINIWRVWMKRFCGVATKYLSNYLHWFEFLRNSESKKDKVESLINILLHHKVNLGST
jgi:transposase-like protein